MRLLQLLRKILLDVFELIDEYAGLFIVLGLVGLAVLTVKVLSDESHTRSEARHTRHVQIQGGPVAVCLLEALKAAEPLLIQAPAVERPLETYVQLQSSRYPGVRCPDAR